MSSFFLLAQLASTLFMTGLIWTIQLVHYPLFAKVGREHFADYEKSHTNRISVIVLPVMLVEAACTIFSVLRPSEFLSAPAAWWGCGVLAMIWGSTFFVQVPLHGRLTDGFDAAAHRRLVASNWIRTVGWTIRASILLGAAANAMSTVPAE